MAIRSAWYAGTWYSGEPKSLKATILESIDEAQKVSGMERSRGAIRFALLPHAGLFYSGRGIAPLVIHAPQKIRKALILAPSHSLHLSADSLSWGVFEGFDTPLGRLSGLKVPAKNTNFNSAIQREHAVEMVLPFLAYLQEKQNSPIEVATALISHVSEMGKATTLATQILDLLGEGEVDSGEVLVIASSDFTHYGPRFNFVPYGVTANNEVVARVKAEDLKVATFLARGELGPLFLKQRTARDTICGLAGGAVVSALAKSVASQGWVADYYTSLDVANEKSNDFVAYSTILWR
ncbi:MAG: AmmeMemoRadiSam system protein B [Sphaerochaetaceae bacterium]